MLIQYTYILLLNHSNTEQECLKSMGPPPQDFGKVVTYTHMDWWADLHTEPLITISPGLSYQWAVGIIVIKLVPYVTAVDSERRRHLANVIAIAKAFANWTETLPSSKSCDTKTRTDIKNLLHTKVRYCSVVSESVVICQLTWKMGEEIDFENRRISNFKVLVTLTLDRVIQHTVVHHSSTSTYILNFIGIGKTFCERTYGRTWDTYY